MKPRILLICMVAICAGCTALPRPAPRSEAPRVEAPRVEAPRVEAPRVEAPRVEAPRVEAPRVEATFRMIEMEQVSNLINYTQSVAAMHADEQRRELASANQSFVRESGPATRLKLALLLSLPGAVIADDARAVSLLEPLAGGSPSPSLLRRFAALLHAQVAERVREQKRSAQLREQLDALKAMERSLMERSQGRPR